jgi:hypothetical protein
VVREVSELVQALEQLGPQDPDKGRHGGRDVGALLAETVNETTNRLNGIINYAQLLKDSAEHLSMTQEQQEMLEKIIDSGAYIAEEWQNIK